LNFYSNNFVFNQTSLFIQASDNSNKYENFRTKTKYQRQVFANRAKTSPTNCPPSKACKSKWEENKE